MMADDDDFERQLQQEAAERERQEDDTVSVVNSGTTRVEDDGTVMEFDVEKRAWFPKIDDFLVQYQMNYGIENTATTAEPAATTDTVTSTTTTDVTTTTHAAADYATYYQQYYDHTGAQPADAKAYWDNYNKYCREYYKWKQVADTGGVEGGSGADIGGVEGESGADIGGVEGGSGVDGDVSDKKEGLPTESKETGSDGDDASTGEEPHSDGKVAEKDTQDGNNERTKESVAQSDDTQPEYDYAAYYHYYYYSQQARSGGTAADAAKGDAQPSDDAKSAQKIAFEPTGNKEYDDYWSAYFTQHEHILEEDEMDEGKTEEGEDGEAGKKDAANKKGKRKEPDLGWFDVNTDKLTSVYVSGLPVDITDQEFKDLMNKCGLVMYDPRTRKPKLKLYKEKTGENKGDGLCCYIKPESVELALQILDGYEMRGNYLSVEVAQFQLKGQYDPAKKKKKLSNREKKRMRKQQEKLFNWHLEKDAPVRQKRERIIVITNLFDPDVFEGNPVLINNIRDEVRKECSKYGEVRKVIVYDRHKDGIASVIFKLAEEADVCSTAMNKRMWGTRLITAEAWDGNTKYEVEETEAEREKRIQEWGNFLDGEEKAKVKTQGKKDGENKTDGTKEEDDTKTAGKEVCGNSGGDKEGVGKCKDSDKMEEEVCGEDAERDDMQDATSGEKQDAVSEEVMPEDAGADIDSEGGVTSTSEQAGQTEDAVSDAGGDIDSEGGATSTSEQAGQTEDAVSDAGGDIDSEGGATLTSEQAGQTEDAVSDAGADIDSEGGATSTSEQAGQTEDAACTGSMETDVPQEPLDGSTV